MTGAGGSVGRALLGRLSSGPVRPLVACVRPGREGDWPDGVRVLRLDVAAFDPAQVAASCADVGEIVHLAAEVSGASPDARFERTNVDGTRSIVQLASLLGARLHQVSTLSVFTHAARVEPVIDESTTAPPLDALDSAYAKTKRAAEVLVQSEPDLATVVWRPGLLVAPDDRSRDGHLARVIRGLAKCGAVPADRLEGRFDATPRARFVEALVDALDRSDVPRVLHVAGARSYALAELVAALRRAGVAVTERPRREWESIPAADPDVLVAQASLSVRARGLRILEATGTAFATTLLDATFPATRGSVPDLLDRLVIHALESMP